MIFEITLQSKINYLVDCNSGSKMIKQEIVAHILEVDYFHLLIVLAHKNHVNSLF